MRIFWPSKKIHRVEKRIGKIPQPNVITDTSVKIGWVRKMIQDRANAILRKKADKWLIAASGYNTKHLLKDMSDEELVRHITMSQWIVEAGWDIILSEMNTKGITWRKLAGVYKHPKLKLFRWRIQTGCGIWTSEMWPFYCPIDGNIFIDPTFYTTFHKEFAERADDFLPLYVQWHEKWHHVQNMFWIISFANQLKEELQHFPAKVNKVQQILELQADYLLGVALHHANKRKPFIEADDIGEAMEIAMSIWDDMLQHKKIWYHVPEAYTHGDSWQRALAFLKWLESGDWEFGLKMMNQENIKVHVIDAQDDNGVIFFDPTQPTTETA